MPLHQLVQFCHEQYSRPGRCDDCPNEDCLNSCTGCLGHIHQVGTHDRTYNCPNIVYCYTCKYVYRYSSEMEFLFNRYNKVFGDVETVRLWSIGCGPATELFGLDNFKTNNQKNFNIEYKGFDLNETWNPIHRYIQQLDHFQAQFYNEDIYGYINATDERPHFIVLNYLISDILRTNREYIDEFVENLCTWYARLDKTFLIINDINLGRNNNESRFYYSVIIQRVRELIGPNQYYHIGRYHFANSHRYYHKYGAQNPNNQVQIVPDLIIVDSYSPWMECRGAQLVLFHKSNE